MERVIKAFQNSIEGLRSAFKTEKAFREDLVIFAIFFPIALFSEITHLAKAVLIGSLFLILITELCNTAIEAVVDRISEDKHPLSKKAKDVGSALVLLALVNAAICWALVFFI